MREAWRQGSTRSRRKPQASRQILRRALGRRQDELLRDVQYDQVESRYWGGLPAGRLLQASPAEGGRRHLLFAPRRLERDRFWRPGEPRAATPASASTSAIRGKRKSSTKSCRCLTSPNRARSTAARRTCSAKASGCRCAATTTARRSISRSSAPARAAERSPASSPKPAFPSSPSMPGRSGGRSRISPPTSARRAACSGPTSGSPAATTRSSSGRTTAAAASAEAPSITP